jgi:hypothetical protein
VGRRFDPDRAHLFEIGIERVNFKF